MVINPGNFEDGFNDRLQGLMDYCRNMEPVCLLCNYANCFVIFHLYCMQADPEKPVLVAGDPERQHMNKSNEAGGIAYHPNQVKYDYDLAKELNIEPPKLL